MSGPEGDWSLTIDTPIGALPVTLSVTRDENGTLSGTATSRDETVVMKELTATGARLTWHQSVTRPIRLNLSFDVRADGDTMTGHARAGRLPRASISGVRVQ